jgi:hypothetical protein
MDIDDLANQVAGEIEAEFFLTDWSYWNYDLTLIHVAGNLYKGTIEMSWALESYSAGVEVVYDGNNYQWEVFDGLPDPEAPPPVDDYEVPPDPDIVEPPPFDDCEVPPDSNVVEPSDGFQVTCVHCNDCYDNGNCVVCPHCYYTASDSYWPFDCRCPDCGKRLDGHNCASCLEFTPFNQMPDYLAQVSPSVEVTEPSEDVETSTVEIKRLPIMPLLVIIFICAATVWFFSDKLEWLKQEIAEGTEQVSESFQEIAEQVAPEILQRVEVERKAQVAKRTFRTLPVRPELSASIAEQADYIVESCAYWCGQLAQALESDSATIARALTEDLPIYLSAHRSTLDLCYAKIIASEATIAERLNDSPGVQRKRMAAIDSVKRELEAVETYLAKCDILWDEVSASLSGSQSSSSNERTRDWVSQLHNLMEGASTMLQ